MSTIINLIEITSLKTADVLTTGLFPTSGLTQISGIKEGTAQLNIGEPASTDIKIEESNVPFTTIFGSREADLTVEMIGADAAALTELLGGTYTAATVTDPEIITFPADPLIVTQAVELTGKNHDGAAMVFQIPKCKIAASFTGQIGRGQARGWTLKCKILTPFNGSNVAQPWLYIHAGAHT